MQDPPSGPDLLDIAAEVLRDEIVPALHGPAVYHARIAASLIAMVARELRLAPAGQAAEGDRLRALLATEESDLMALNRALSARLRDGSLAVHDASVMRHLHQTVVDKLAIDNPASPRLRDAAPPGGGAAGENKRLGE